MTEAAERERLRRGAARSGAGEAEKSSSDESCCNDGWLLDDWPDRALLKHASAQRFEKSVPEMNDRIATAAFAKTCPHGRIQAQPLFHKDLRTSQKDRASEALRLAVLAGFGVRRGLFADKRRRAYHDGNLPS